MACLNGYTHLRIFVYRTLLSTELDPGVDADSLYITMHGLDTSAVADIPVTAPKDQYERTADLRLDTRIVKVCH